MRVNVPSGVQRNAWSLVASLVAMLFLAAPSSTQDFVVDQANDSFSTILGWGIGYFSPIGQEFTPVFDHVDVVELWVFVGNDTELELRIRSDTISGTPLGECLVEVEQGHDGPLRFVFDEPVPVMPGERYVIHVLDLAAIGQTTMGVEFYDPNQYAGGRIIRWGDPFEERDAWFREGVWEPTEVGEHTWGSIKALYR